MGNAAMQRRNPVGGRPGAIGIVPTARLDSWSLGARPGQGNGTADLVGGGENSIIAQPHSLANAKVGMAPAKSNEEVFGAALNPSAFSSTDIVSRMLVAVVASHPTLTDHKTIQWGWHMPT
jgi:hypothetical protein